MDTMIKVDEILENAQFMVDQRGQTTGVFLPLATWEALLTWLEELEDAEDRSLLRERLSSGRLSEAPEMLRWDEISARLADDKTS